MSPLAAMGSAQLLHRPCSKCLSRPCFTSKRPRHVTCYTSTHISPQDTQTAYANLCGFIKQQGGFVHPALQLDAIAGGIVAAQDIPVLKGSLVELPLSVRLTTEVAQELLLPALNAAGLPTMSLLDESQQLALAVAWLKNQGQSSGAAAAGEVAAAAAAAAAAKWHPYITSMPSQIPCGWAKTAQQLSADYETFLKQHGLDESWWRYFVAQVHDQMSDQAAQLSVRYSTALGITADDILWALGLVTARKVVVDDQVLLEPWSDLLRHPPSSACSSSSSSRCEVQWSYGLDRSGTSVVSRGAGRRISTGAGSSSSSSSGGGGGSSSGDAAADSTPQQQHQQQQNLLLAAGEELWASSTSSSSGSSSSSSSSSNVNELFSSFVSEHGHLAPLAWYLQHGHVPQGLAGVNMRTSDILDSWRLTVEAESAAATAPSSGSSSSSSSKPATVLWDYLTQQYQQDALTVLAATPKEHQQELLRWLLKPVTDVAAGDAGSSSYNRIVANVDPLPMIGVLDELLLAAIDAADEDAL